LRIWLFLQVGRLRVIGAENLNAPGRLVFCPNHGSMFDFVAYLLMHHRTHYMGAYEEMSGIWGLKGIVMGAVGCFPVDRSNGKTVLGPATQLLVSGRNVLLFPEGHISASGEFLPFKKGAAYIANGAYDQLGGKERVGIVPVHIRYHRRDPATAAIDNYLKMGFKWCHCVTVTVCKPIWLHELSSRNPEEIMASVRAALMEQECASRAQAAGKR